MTSIRHLDHIISRLPRLWRAAALLLCVVALASTTLAQSKEDLVSTLAARKAVVAEGRETLVPGDVAKPGDTIEYQATYFNQSARQLGNVQGTVPIPEGSRLLANAAKPAPTSASTDGKTFSTYPLKRTVLSAEGKKEVVPVPFAEYRALRWNLGSLAPGATTTVAARVEIVTNAPAAAPK